MIDKKFLILIMLILFFTASAVSASEITDVNLTSTAEDSSIEIAQDDIQSADILQNSPQDLISTDDDIIVVNNWDELQYYCSLTDKDYTLKLKDNTNFYPSNYYDKNYQIVINNNVKIIGGNGSYIGDSSQHDCYIKDGRYVVEGGNPIKYALIMVPDNNRMGLTLENITFKWDYIEYNPDGVLLQMGGKAKNYIRNCVFENINTMQGHSCIVYLKKGDALLENCSFINCTTDFGCVSLYDPNSYTTARMTVKDCYFENNFARTEPGCINNCAILTVYNTTFYHNRAGVWAGAIHTHFYASATIYDSNFTDNVAGWNGGALYTYSNLTIYNTVFSGNNCTTNNGGGAIGACRHVSSPHVYVENSLFENNENLCWSLDEMSTTSTGRGGAISLMDEGSLEVRNTTFISNSASIGTAISATEAGTYGSPDIYIINNTFINHTRAGDVFNIRVNGTVCNISDNYYLGNSIVFSNLTLTKLDEGKEQATLQISAVLKNPSYYDSDILDKTLYDVYVNDKYVKTVNSTVFTVDFGDLDICDAYVIPTISNRKSNAVTLVSTREYIFVSKNNGNDNNDGISRNTPVNTIQKALELAETFQNIILLDGDYSENIQISYDVTIKGEGNATLTGDTSFISNANLTLKNLKISNLNADTFITNNNNLVISNCIFTNNGALLVQNNGFASLTNSILLNNSNIIQGNDALLDYNWWGSLLPDLNIDKYVTLNLTSDVTALENNQKANVKAVFYLNDGTKYSNLPDIELDITTVNGAVNQNITKVDSRVIYTLTGFDDGALTVSYNDFTSNITFEFLKSAPAMSLTAQDIMFGDNLTITVTLPADAEGNLTVSVGNITQNKIIESKNTVFTFENLKADNYTVSVTYSGDKKYMSKTITSEVNVNRYPSSTTLNISEFSVGEDVILTVTTTDSATGNVTLSINDDTQILTLIDSKANYTIEKIRRGDYLITAIYNGDDRYMASEDSRFIEVDNLNATMTIQTEDITYGDIATVKIILNDDATGNVIVTIDNESNSSEVINGYSEVTFTNLEAGENKIVSVFYSGDNTYFNLTGTDSFSIAKADLTFTMESKNIKIGQTAEIIIKVPAKTSGTFTIGSDVMTIPFSGRISYSIPDLEIGNYSYTATYEGNNYNTVSNTTYFEVCEYTPPQWANSGGDTRNTQKSPYESLTDGKILFNIDFDGNISGDLVIDSAGNIYIIGENAVYCYNQSDLLWNFSTGTVSGILSGAAIGRDVISTPKSGDTLYFINQTTGEKYGSSNIYQASSLFAPIIDSNATLYVISEYQYDSSDYKLVIVPYKSWESGGAITEIFIGDTMPLCSPTLNDDMIVVVSENRLRIIDAKTLKTISTKSGNYQPVRPVIDDSNTVYLILSNNIIAYDNAGSQVWKTKVTGGVGNTLAVDDDAGYVYHVNAKGSLYRYSLFDGKEELVSSLNVTSNILIGENGNLYFGSGSTFYGLDINGSVLWHADVKSNIIGNPVMDKNGTIYVKTETGVVALGQIILKPSNISITAESITYGEDLIVNVNLNDGATGLVNVTVGDKTLAGNLVNSSASFTFTGLDIGSYIVYAEYGGDLQFNKSSTSVSVTVNKAKPEIAVSADAIAYGENLIVNVQMPSDVSRRPSVTVGNETKYVTLKNGTGSVKFSGLKVGKHTVTVSYGGDSVYEKGSVNITATVSKAQPNIKITADAINYGDNLVVTVSMPSDVSKRPQVTVGNESKYVSLKNGTGSVSFKGLKIGKYDVTVSYAGDNNYLKSEKSVSTRVNRGTADIKITASNINYGETLNVAIKLPSDVTRRAKVTVDNESKTVSLKDGEATVKFTGLSRGKHTITVTYDGDNNYLKSTANKTVTVNKGSADIKVTAKAIAYGETLKVVVDLPADTTRRATVTVGNESKYVSLKSNVAEFTGLAVGTHEVTVSYGGDDNYLKTVVTANAKVNKATPEIEILADDIFEGETLKVDVRLPEGVTRRAMVSIGDTSKYVTLKNGIGTAKFTGLATGSYKVKVTYDGDANYKASSNTININVK